MSTGIVDILDIESVSGMYPLNIACKVVIGALNGANKTLEIDLWTPF